MRKFLLVFALLALPSVGFSSDLVIRLNSYESKTSNKIVTIGDIAEVRSSDESLAASVRKLDLEVLKVAGKPVTIDRKQVELRLRVSQHSSENFTVSGSYSVNVHLVARFRPEKTVANAINQAISKQFGISGDDIRVSIDSTISSADLSMLANTADRSLIVLPNELPIGSSKVQFVYRTDEGIDRNLEVECRITIETELIVAKYQIPRGKAITSQDIQLVKRPMDNSRLKHASLKQAIGSVALTNIPAKSIVRVTDLALSGRQPTVRRNDIVDILFYGDGISLRVKNARVLTAGKIGDRIEVLNPDSEKKLVAKVVNSNLVVVR